MRTFDVTHLAARRSFKLQESESMDSLKRERSMCVFSCILLSRANGFIRCYRVHMTLEEALELGRPPSPKLKQWSRQEPTVNNWRRPLPRYNGSPRNYFKSEKDRSLSPRHSCGSRSRSRSRPPKYCRKDSRSRSSDYRRTASRSRSPDSRRRASRSRSPKHRRRDSRLRSRSPEYGNDSDCYKRGCFKMGKHCRHRSPSSSPPRNSHKARARSHSSSGGEREYCGPEPPPPPSNAVYPPTPKTAPPSKSASGSNTPSIVARLRRECSATRADIASAATRGRLLESQLAVLSASSPPSGDNSASFSLFLLSFEKRHILIQIPS
ncbi:hypothetical protein B0H16DRAFT_808788 [Mycena metata]|uniref:Uncharacterized protein n=1 Tax=Mycena metata TaxID=1033252 RepID=A0AAD7NXP1_9AGAR|nr:hypothetical protein B0H16DRAFT_808788 [Mycena metata]